MPNQARLPADLSGIPVYVLDPMLATGGSMVHAIDLLGVEALANSGLFDCAR